MRVHVSAPHQCERDDEKGYPISWGLSLGTGFSEGGPSGVRPRALSDQCRGQDEQDQNHDGHDEQRPVCRQPQAALLFHAMLLCQPDHYHAFPVLGPEREKRLCRVERSCNSRANMPGLRAWMSPDGRGDPVGNLGSGSCTISGGRQRRANRSVIGGRGLCSRDWNRLPT
jgi:hypothetical protein